MVNLLSRFKQFHHLSLETQAILVSTILLLIMIPITVWAVEKRSEGASLESFAAGCTDAEAKATWLATPGCFVNKTVSWNSVSYEVQIRYPKGLDPDQDGFTTKEEKFIGTDPADSCADNVNDDAWPMDVDNDGVVSTSDIFKVVEKFGTSKESAGYSPRYDLSANGAVTIEDIFKVVQFFGETCGSGSGFPFRKLNVPGTTVSTTNLERNTNFGWKVCYPNCNNSSYNSEGTASSNSSGKLSLSWPGIDYEIVAIDQNCGSSFCVHPGTPKKILGTSTTLTNLYPNRSYKLVACYPTCGSGTQLQTIQFTSPNCSGGGGTYSVVLKRNNSSFVVRNEVFNRTTTSHTFTGLPSNTPYDYYVYNPSGNHSRLYKKGDVTSNAGTCKMTEAQMRDAIHYLININRGQNGRENLAINSALVSAARVRAQETTVSFSHTRPDGRSSVTVLDDRGISHSWYGEILGRNNYPNDLESIEVNMRDWMNSSGHRANILNSNYTQMGAAVVKHSDGFNYYTVEFRRP